MLRTAIAATAAAVLLTTAPGAVAQPPAPPTPIVPPPGQPHNLGDLKAEVIRYHDSGAYLTDLQAAAAPAIAWITERVPQVSRPAIVLDIDETSLSNWEVLRANDFALFTAGPCPDLPHGPCGLAAWLNLGDAPAIPPTLDIFTTARGLGAEVFFLTGRPENLRAATERNLHTVGYRGYTRLIMEPVGSEFVSAADFKAPQRERLTREGYTIVANIGDQPSDLAGGFAERAFLLPNPFYRIS